MKKAAPPPAPATCCWTIYLSALKKQKLFLNLLFPLVWHLFWTHQWSAVCKKNLIQKHKKTQVFFGIYYEIQKNIGLFKVFYQNSKKHCFFLNLPKFTKKRRVFQNSKNFKTFGILNQDCMVQVTGGFCYRCSHCSIWVLRINVVCLVFFWRTKRFSVLMANCWLAFGDSNSRRTPKESIPFHN